MISKIVCSLGLGKDIAVRLPYLKLSTIFSKELDNGNISILVLLDFSKAFDTVNFNTLIQKLSCQFGFIESAKKFIESYLSGRSAVIFSNNEYSEPVSICCGVPQGSILGPLLFSLYTNDFPSSLKHMKCHSYADDTQIYKSGKALDLELMCEQINEDLRRVQDWASSNQLKINSQKSQSLVISRRNLQNIPMITMNKEKNQHLPFVKNLGVMFSNRLEWTANIQHICRRLSLDSGHYTTLLFPCQWKLN